MGFERIVTSKGPKVKTETHANMKLPTNDTNDTIIPALSVCLRGYQYPKSQ